MLQELQKAWPSYTECFYVIIEHGQVIWTMDQHFSQPMAEMWVDGAYIQGASFGQYSTIGPDDQKHEEFSMPTESQRTMDDNG